MDFNITGGGTLYVLDPLTPRAKAWIKDHVDDNALTWGPNAIAIEHRYVADIIDGIRADGLEVA